MSAPMQEALNLTLLGGGVVVVVAALSIALFVWWKGVSDRKN